MDRVGRSLKHLIEFLNTLKEREIDFVSITEKIDTTTPGGKLIFHMMGALAEFERDLIRERTKAGLDRVLECAAVMLHGQKSKIGEVFAL
ncbi:hypothetical protein KSD_60190 [Ktedonobacter sp. SOSP1-85]|nr:hypothetical protein KSD_60190 [Ktedonobacter sp. SOSP1-85]